MAEIKIKRLVKDLGLKREVMEALPYAVVGDAWEGSFTENYDEYTVSTYEVPARKHGASERVRTSNLQGYSTPVFSFILKSPAASRGAGDS